MLVFTTTLAVWHGEPINEIQYPPNIEVLWTDQDLAQLGLERVLRFDVPDGYRITGPASVVRQDDGKLHIVYPVAAPTVGEDEVKMECSNRIYAVADDNTQKNLTGYATTLAALPALGVNLTPQQKLDLQLFAMSVQWIKAMRATWPSLVGDPDYRNDDKWPVCPEDVKSLASRTEF